MQLVVSSPDFTLPQPKTQSSLTFGFTRFFPFFREDGGVPETTKDDKVPGRWVLYLKNFRPSNKSIQHLVCKLVARMDKQELGPR